MHQFGNLATQALDLRIRLCEQGAVAPGVEMRLPAWPTMSYRRVLPPIGHVPHPPIQCPERVSDRSFARGCTNAICGSRGVPIRENGKSNSLAAAHRD